MFSKRLSSLLYIQYCIHIHESRANCTSLCLSFYSNLRVARTDRRALLGLLLRDWITIKIARFFSKLIILRVFPHGINYTHTWRQHDKRTYVYGSSMLFIDCGTLPCDLPLMSVAVDDDNDHPVYTRMYMRKYLDISSAYLSLFFSFRVG